MPALAADWCCGDGTSKASSFVDSKLTKNHNFNRSGVEAAKQNHVDKGIHYLNGSSPALNGTTDDIPPPKVSLFDSSKLRLQWPHSRPVGAGLTNLGNTCFLNSVLQCLSYTVPLAHHLTMDEHKRMCKVKDFCMLCVLQDHLSRSFRGGQPFKPLQVLQNLRNIAKSLSWGQQEDAHEFLRYVVDSMQKSCLVGTNGLDKYSKETTFVYQVFSGYLRSQVKCLRCVHASNTYDPFLDLSVDIKDVSSLEQALVKFVSPEKLDIENAYKCERCKVRVPAHKRFTIHRTSNVLTVHLKRFDMSRPLGSKLSRHIKFPVEMNIRPYMSVSQGERVDYVLYGVLVHSGFSCTSGHYYCYIKAPNRQWYCMNDSMVTPSTLSTVLSAEAYILFYVRKSSLSKGSKPHTITQSVHQNGSGDYQANNIIGPQPPSAQISKSSVGASVSNLSVLQKSHSSNTASTSNPFSANSTSTSSYIKFNGIKLKLASHSQGANGNQNAKNKNVAKVLVPSLVPYTEPADSDEEDDSKDLQIDERGSDDSHTKSSANSTTLHFRPRSLLKPAPAASSKMSQLQEMTKMDEKPKSVQKPATAPPESDGKEFTLSAASNTVEGESSTTADPDQPAKQITECNGANSLSNNKTSDTAAHNGLTKPAASRECTSESNAPLMQASDNPKQSSSRHNSQSPKRNGDSSYRHRHEHSRSRERHSRLDSSHHAKHSSHRHSNSPHKAHTFEHSRITHRRSRSPHKHRKSRSKSRRRDRHSRSRSPLRSHKYSHHSSNSSRRSRSRKHKRSPSPQKSSYSRLRQTSTSEYYRSSRKHKHSPSPERHRRPARHRSRSRSLSRSPRRSRSRSSYRSRRRISTRSRSPPVPDRSRHSTSRKSYHDSSRYSPLRTSVVRKGEHNDGWQLSNGNGSIAHKSSGRVSGQYWSNGDHSYSSQRLCPPTNGDREGADQHHKKDKHQRRVHKDEMKWPLLSDMGDNEYEWVEVPKPHHDLISSKENGSKYEGGSSHQRNSISKKIFNMTNKLSTKRL